MSELKNNKVAQPLRGVIDAPEMDGRIYEEKQSKEYIPARGELLRNHEINISFLTVGCIVRVGCKTIPFQSTQEAIKAVQDYIDNPYETTKKWEVIFRDYENNKK